MAARGWRGYAEAVAGGKLRTSRLVRLACERSLDELARYGTAPQRRREYWFDEAAAARACAFFPRFLRHSKGKWAGQRFELSPWQEWIIGQAFGWKLRDGRRRFRKVYCEIPRKNGKSQVAAGVGLLLLGADGEAGAEVYSAATKRDQASIVWSEAKRMVNASPDLRGSIVPYRSVILAPESGGSFLPLGKDSSTLDGLSPHGVVVDELHAHKTREVLDVLETAMGAREQPFFWMITTAGHGGASVCWEQHEYARKVLEGHVDDPTFLSYVAGAEDGDDWTDPATWEKANPNLDVSVFREYLARECEQAKAIPGKQNAFRRLHLNLWTERGESWLSLAEWDTCGAVLPLSEVSDRSAYIGLDLASNRDFAAAVAVVPPAEAGGLWAVDTRLYIPEDSIAEKLRTDRVPLDEWVDAGLVTATPGNLIDHQWIKAGVREVRDELDVAEVVFDPWGSPGIIADLQNEGFECCQFRLGFSSMAPAMRALESLILSRTLAHGGNPALRWMASNVKVCMDPAGNTKPDKKRSGGRIDGIVALLMAVGRASAQGTTAASGPYSGEDDEVLILGGG